MKPQHITGVSLIFEIPSLDSCAFLLTWLMRIPVTIASWCNVPSAPRRAVGETSLTYMGTSPEESPAPSTRRHHLFWTTAQQSAETTSPMGKQDGARLLHPMSHQVPRAWLGTTRTPQRFLDIPGFRAPSWEAFTLEHI